MTERDPQPIPFADGPPVPHFHHGIGGLWTATTRLHHCGHVVVNLGHLDVASHRMVWQTVREELAEAYVARQAWVLMASEVAAEVDRLNTPPW